MKLARLASVLALLLLASTTRATPPQPALLIDITDPMAVTFTATSAFATANGSIAVDFSGGITLENFFPSAQSILTGKAVTGTLTAHGSMFAYDELVTFNYAANTGDVDAGDDLSVYSSTGTDSQNFTTSTSAFTGISTVNLVGFTLPSVGTTGNIDIGFKAIQGGPIGTWKIVSSAMIPEPSTFALLLGISMLGLGVFRRRS